MTRRSLVALVSAAVLVTLGLVVLATVLFVTHTNAGREKLREIARPLVARAVHGGSVYLGHFSGSFINGITIDSVAIRDKRGDLFLSTGRITLVWNPRDLVDDRAYLRHADIEHPYLHLVQHENGEWNFKEIFGSNAPELPKPKELNTRGWGDYVVIDSATTRNATVLLTMPWHPDDALRGAARDSSIHAHLTAANKLISKTFDGYGRTYAWRNASAVVTHARLADPDSDRKFGQEIQIATLTVDEYDPTFRIRNLSGEMRHLGDSIWFQAPRFNMPASTGHGQGKVWWGSDKPVRYDIAIRGDSVALDDINWVYPTLPRTGGGSVDLGIQNDPKNLQIVDFNLAKMDVRSTGSHLTGQMSFGIGAPVLLVRRVDLRADPVDFDLLRTLNGKPFAEDWRGQLFGTVKGKGGPLTNFVVDDAQLTFQDAHVRGAVSRVAGQGELDILNPAYTSFHGFAVDASTVDLRSIEYLFPNFPRLGGFVSGTATLDSSWLDVRFSDAHLIHQDGPGDPTRASGSGRITYGESMLYDLSLNAEPLSLTMLSRSYPLHLTGLMSGPISAKGEASDLALTASLQGPPGAFSFDGRVDADSIGGYGMHGRGEFSGLKLASLLDRPVIAMGPLSGHYGVDWAGESASTVRGTADLALEPTTVSGVRVYQSTARVRFADGKMSVDSLRVHTKAATLVAKSAGGIGLPHGRPDSLAFTIEVDSLGGLRPLFFDVDSTVATPTTVAAAPDSLSGSVTVSGTLRGTLDSLSIDGTASTPMGIALNFRNERADSLYAKFDFRDVFRAPAGFLDVRLDSALLGGVSVDSLKGHFVVDDSTHRRFALAAASTNGPTIATSGAWSSAGRTQTVRIDSLGLAIGVSRWHLDRPTRLVIDSGGSRLDSLILRNRDTAVVVLTEAVPLTGPAFAQFHAVHVPLFDVGTLLQLSDTISGTADVTASATGTKAQPAVVATAVLSSVRWAGMNVDQATANARYQDGRLRSSLDVVRGGKSALTARVSLPASMSLFGMTVRRADSLSGSLTASRTDLSILQPLFPSVQASGFLTANVRVSGSMVAPLYAGSLQVDSGFATAKPLGVKFNNITARVSGGVSTSGQDSVSVTVGATTADEQHNGSVSITGFVKNVMQTKAPMAFNLALVFDTLHAYNRRTVADLYLTSPRLPNRQREPLRLTGTTNASTLTGTLNVDHSSIFLLDADLARKQAVDLVVAEQSDVAAAASGVPVLNRIRANMVSNVTVNLGDDVRLRSAEANVRLGGHLALTGPLAFGSVPSLAGQLTTIGGTYNLNLGIVQREFQVLSDGTVTFDGAAQDPLLDIKAQYAVKQYHDRDLNVIVNLSGRVKTPKIQFSSDADYEISQSDLVSYLVLGKPGLDFGANSDAREVLASVIAPTLSAYAADRLRQSVGWLDMLQFQLGGGNYTTSGTSPITSQTFSSYLYGATIGAEKQVTSKLYLNVNSGLCQLQNSPGNRNALTGLGAKAEYRFKPTLSLDLAYDPPTASRTCNADGQQSIVGLVPTPPNFSLAFSHTWRF